jgi:hypothetical protein
MIHFHICNTMTDDQRFCYLSQFDLFDASQGIQVRSKDCY